MVDIKDLTVGRGYCGWSFWTCQAVMLDGWFGILNRTWFGTKHADWPLLISEALASVVALYAGKVRVAWTIQTHDDLGVVVWFVSFCLVLMLSGRSGSTLFPWNTSYLTIACHQFFFVCETVPTEWLRFSSEYFSLNMGVSDNGPQEFQEIVLNGRMWQLFGLCLPEVIWHVHTDQLGFP